MQAGNVALRLRFALTAGRVDQQALDCTLPELLARQDGVLSEQQQQEILNIYERLGSACVYHGDPNPLNFMADSKGRLYVIDFGMSKDTSVMSRADVSVYGATPSPRVRVFGATRSSGARPSWLHCTARARRTASPASAPHCRRCGWQ